jgi:uncharacterized protein
MGMSGADHPQGDGEAGGEAGWLKLPDGQVCDLAEMPARCFTLQNIAHSLAHQNRFNGHTTRPLTVAEHSVMAALLVPPELALAALLHDAHEMITGDIPAPVCWELGLDLAALKQRIDAAVAQYWGLEQGFAQHPTIRTIDEQLLITEARDFMPEGEREITGGVSPLNITLEGWPPAEAKRRFIDTAARVLISDRMRLCRKAEALVAGLPPYPPGERAARAGVDFFGDPATGEPLSGGIRYEPDA